MKVRFPGTAGTFTVTFDANGGSGTMKDVKDVSGEYELPESLFNAPEDKTFDCWLVEGKEYAAGDTITVTSDVTVKAQWKDMPAHVHKLTLKEEKKATCTEDGLKAHYICDSCDRWFEDATGVAEIRDKSSYVIDAQGQWRLAADGWHFDLLGGSQAAGWQNILYNGRYGWYYFDENGLMQTGWINDNGSRYYLNPVSDGWMGEMFTGWHQIDGKWYYFETMPGYNQGHMYVDTVTPDGYYCGADGAWDGMPAGSGR